jgi:hypothetical protein
MEEVGHEETSVALSNHVEPSARESSRARQEILVVVGEWMKVVVCGGAGAGGGLHIESTMNTVSMRTNAYEGNLLRNTSYNMTSAQL